MPRFMGFVRMEEGLGAPPQAMFDAMDTYVGEQAAKGVFLDGGGLYGTEDAVKALTRALAVELDRKVTHDEVLGACVAIGGLHIPLLVQYVKERS